MSYEIRLPQISGQSTEEQVLSIRNYLYQTVEQLNYALSMTERDNEARLKELINSSEKEKSSDKSQTSFNEIKSLIIKSADIVNAYYEKITQRLESVYVAQSEFGIYTEKTASDLAQTSTAVETLYTSQQEIITDIEDIESNLIGVNAHIKAGLLYYDGSGVPIYGIEIGQISEVDGVEVFNKYARFTSGRLTFYDKNNSEVAYISDYKLYITNAHITGSLMLGADEGYVLDPSDGLIIRWV